MSNNIEQLTQEILQICQGQEMGCVLSALCDATEQALRSVSHEDARAGFLITHIQPLTFVVTYDGQRMIRLKGALAEVANIHNEGKRNARIIGYIKALAEAGIESPHFDEDTFLQKLAAVHMPFGDE